MIIHNIGYNHRHDADFIIERPNGSGDCLLLLLKTPAIFTINDIDLTLPKNTFFLYSEGCPQRYRCIPFQPFVNDWIHFSFEGQEAQAFLDLGLTYETPVTLRSPYFISFCIKSIAGEYYSNHQHKQSNIQHYFALLCNHVSEGICTQHTSVEATNYFELLSAVRNRMYSGNYRFYSVESSAHEICMSKSNFQHLYKKYFGVSFMEDLIQSRIEHAKTLLIHTQLTSADIAKQCGYQTFAHFSRQFKKIVGMSPLTFRKEYQSIP